MAGRTLTVYLAADTTKFRTAMSGAEASMDGLDGKVGGFSGKLSGMLSGALMGATAAAGAFAVKMGVDGVQAAIADEAAAAKLATTLQNLGLAHDTAAVEAMIDALQRQTGVADDELRPAFGRLVTSLGDTKLATDALKLAMDISAGTGKDLDGVVAALAKAYDGNTGALSRLGAGLDAQILKTGDMDLITQALATTFGGQAEKAAGTYQGSINRLSIGFDELKESFGAGFLDGLGNADTKTGDLMGTMQDFDTTLQDLGKSLGETLTTVAELVGWIKDIDTAVQGFAENLGPAGDAIQKFTNPLGHLLELIQGVGRAADIARGAIDAMLGRQAQMKNGPITSIGGGVFE